MEREELLQQVQSEIESQGRTLSPSLSQDSIDGELDDVLEDFGDDDEANKKLVSRIAKRLLRMDGNIHSNVSAEVKKYKEQSGKGGKSEEGGSTAGKGEEGKGDDDDVQATLKALKDEIASIRESQTRRAKADSDAAIVASVKSKLTERFKKAGVEVNGYIYNQTVRDLEVPEHEEGERVDVASLADKLERAYFRNLKEAGLDNKDTGRSRNSGNGGGKGETAADRFFAKKGKREGWKK